jgi:hypothetical protein
MRGMRLALAVFLIAIFSAPLRAQRPTLAAEKLLTIGPGNAAGLYLFCQITAVRTDASGNIYVLDFVRARIMKFNALGQFVGTIGTPIFDVASSDELRKILFSNLPETRTKARASNVTGEIFGPKALFLDENGLFVLDTDKLVTYDASGALRKVIPLAKKNPQLYPYLRAAFPDDQGTLVLVGQDVQGRLFHVVNDQGDIVRSYGDKFEIPPDVVAQAGSDLEDSAARMMSAPVSVSVGAAGDILILSPFRYEIRCYRGERLARTLEGPPPYASGFAGFIRHSVDGKPAGLSSGHINPPVLLEQGGLILVFQLHEESKNSATNMLSFKVDVFNASGFLRSYDVTLEGYPNFLAPGGRLFTIGHSERPFINEYVLKGLPGN